jgi:hypothetical protein
MNVFSELYYELKKGDKIIFLPNPYIFTNNYRFDTVIEKISENHSICIDGLYFNGNYFFNNLSFDQRLYKKIKIYNLKTNNYPLKFFDTRFAFIYINDEIKITQISNDFYYKLVDEYDLNYNNILNFNFRKFYINDYHTYSIFRETKYEKTINKIEYVNYIFDNNIKGIFNDYFQKYMIQNNFITLHNFLLENNATELLNDSIYKKYIRQLKIQEIL